MATTETGYGKCNECPPNTTTTYVDSDGEVATMTTLTFCDACTERNRHCKYCGVRETQDNMSSHARTCGNCARSHKVPPWIPCTIL